MSSVVGLSRDGGHDASEADSAVEVIPRPCLLDLPELEDSLLLLDLVDSVVDSVAASVTVAEGLEAASVEVTVVVLAAEEEELDTKVAEALVAEEGVDMAAVRTAMALHHLPMLLLVQVATEVVLVAEASADHP